MELLQLQVVACLATFPAASWASRLGPEDHAAAIQFLLTHATSPRAAQPALSAVATKAIAEAVSERREVES